MANFTTACGHNLIATQQFLGHMSGHSTVTNKMLTNAILKITLDFKADYQMAIVDLGYQTGFSGLIVLPRLVEMDEAIWFGFRGTDRLAPSPIAKGHQGFPTNHLNVGFKPVEGIWTLVTAYSCNLNDPNPGPEPITPMHTPAKNLDWQEKRDIALLKWRGFQLAEGPADLRDEPFISTWTEVMEEFGAVYH